MERVILRQYSGILVNLVTWIGMNQPISHWGTLGPLVWFMMATYYLMTRSTYNDITDTPLRSLRGRIYLKGYYYCTTTTSIEADI